MWGLIKTEVSGGWFVPSRAEWSAFAQELGIDETNYEDKGLGGKYWSSSQGDTDLAYSAEFYSGYMSFGNVRSYNYVRLTTTF